MLFEKKIISFSKLYTAMLIFGPMLSAYQLGGLSFGILCLLVIALLILIFERKLYMHYPKYIMLFFVFMIVTRVLNSDSFSLDSLFSFSLISFVVLVGVNGGYFNLEYGIKIYRMVVVFCCIFFLMQEVQYFIFGSRTVGLLNFLSLDTNEAYGETISRLSVYPRSASLFLEPSHFSEFLLPLLAIELFNSKSHSAINFYVVLITVVFLLMESGIGLIILALIWAIWFLYHSKNFPVYLKMILVLIVFPIAIGTSYFFRSDIGGNVLERTEEFGIVDATTSTYVRIFRGYSLFDEFRILNKVVGMNSSLKIESIISKGDMFNLFLEDDLSFNGIQSILIYGGIVGLLLFSLHFHYLFKMNGIEGRIIGIVFIGLSLMAAVYLKPTMLLCYALIYAYHREYVDAMEANNEGIIHE